MSEEKKDQSRKEEEKGPEDFQSDSESLEIPETMPLLPIRDLVVFPYMIAPLAVGRENSIRALDEALKHNRFIFLVAQQRGEVEEPGKEDVHQLGTVSVIVRMLKMPDGKAKILVQGLQRARIKEFLQTEPFFSVQLDLLSEEVTQPLTIQFEAMIRTTRESFFKAVQLGKPVSPEVLAVAENVKDPGRLADIVGSSLDLGLKEAQQVLETVNPFERLAYVHEVLDREVKVLEMQQKIQDQTKEELSRTQKEYYLRQQMKAIQQELGDKGEREAAKFKRFAVRTARWRWVGRADLYDIPQDPGQKDNVAERHPEVVRRLRSAYVRWWDSTLPFLVNEDQPRVRADQQPFAVLYDRQLKERGIPEWEPGRP